MNRSDHIRVVALDADGTLLTPEGLLHSSTRPEIERIAASGVVVIVATGKTAASVEAVRQDLGIDGNPVVANQGLVVRDGSGRIVHNTVLTREVVAESQRFAAEFGLEVFGYVPDAVLCTEDSERSRWFGPRYDEPVRLVDRLDPELNKLLLVVPVGSVGDDLRQAAVHRFADVAHVTQAVPESLEILPIGTSKAAGVAVALDHLGFDPSQLLAVGDGDNDREMLAAAAVGVAMGNATESLKEIADHVVASNADGGVAEALQLVLPASG